MRLEKWYGDVVDHGVATILYCANLKIGPLCISYRREIHHSERRASAFKLGEDELPRVEQHNLMWPGLNAPVWCGCRSRPQTLWDSAGRTLTWDPLVLNGEVAGLRLSPLARGYVERLTLDFSPSELGLTSLQWGRFCGRAHSLVWIEWQGKNPKSLAILDGKKSELVQPCSEDVRDVRCRGGTLKLGARETLVHEPISPFAAWALGPIAHVGWLRFLEGTETKWLTRAELELSSGERDAGYAIHEVVAWPH